MVKWIGKALRIAYVRLIGQGLRTTWQWLYEKVARVAGGLSPAEMSQVGDGLYVGGQHSRRGLAAMRRLGIGATISLRAEVDDAARGVALPRHLWLPTPDDGAPSVAQLSRGVAFIRDAVAGGEGVYIHCGQGVGRAPTMAAAYLVSQGRSPEAAWAAIRAVRPFITPTPEQVRRLAEWADGR